MAQVWEGTDTVLGRKVAVKILHPHLAGDEVFVKRFRQEAVAAARLSHPSIVGVYDTVSDAGHEAIVMELLDATTLRRLLDEQGPLDPDTTVRVALRLLDALEVAHTAGVIHRDVKPSNILLCRDGRVKIADFGIAKADDQTELTRDGAMVGTATYLAPEQLTDEQVDGRADLYSLAIVMYECLTGSVPFRGDTGAAIALARLHSTPIDPRRLRADIPADVAMPVMRALSRTPADRFNGAADFRAALLRRASDHHEIELPQPAPEFHEEPTMESESFSRSERRWLFPALLILLIAVAVSVAGLLFQKTTVDPDSSSAAEVAPSDAGTTPSVGISSAGTYDPLGTGEPGENDQLAPAAIDNDPATSWRTESYDSPDFPGPKSGVGLVVNTSGPAKLDQLFLQGSTNGWSAKVFVLPSGDLSNFDPEATEPTANVSDVRTPINVDLGGNEGSTVVLWITNLGDKDQSTRYQVSIDEARIVGQPSGAG